jgi:predicted transglutaminase-like cysteine proteinase
MGCNWAGDIIARDTVVWDKRVVIGHKGVYIPTDIRQWISNKENEVIRRALQEIGLPTARQAGSFDVRAWKIWDYITQTVEYVADKESIGLEDFWLFPEETLILRKGDCEDSSFLLAALLLASGISEHFVRVILGQVVSNENAFGHAWVVYMNEQGEWCLLESTLDSAPDRLVQADAFTQPQNQYIYQPQFSLNSTHLWWISPINFQMADYLRMRSKMPQRRLGIYIG